MMREHYAPRIQLSCKGGEVGGCNIPNALCARNCKENIFDLPEQRGNPQILQEIGEG
jgi:hypothetical protein